MQSNATGPVKLLSVAAVVSLAVSSVGPFTLAYIMASHSGDAILFRDALYTYLHFQYNGYFTLTVMALFFHHKTKAALQADWKKNQDIFYSLNSLCYSFSVSNTVVAWSANCDKAAGLSGLHINICNTH